MAGDELLRARVERPHQPPPVVGVVGVVAHVAERELVAQRNGDVARRVEPGVGGQCLDEVEHVVRCVVGGGAVEGEGVVVEEEAAVAAIPYARGGGGVGLTEAGGGVVQVDLQPRRALQQQRRPLAQVVVRVSLVRHLRGSGREEGQQRTQHGQEEGGEKDERHRGTGGRAGGS